MSTSAVLEALRETPKGRLSYGSQWKHCSSAEKLVRILTNLVKGSDTWDRAFKYYI